MNAMIGVGLLAVTALLFAWAHGQFLRPQPKAWTKGDVAAVSITLSIVCLFTFSLAFLGAFLLDIAGETRWPEIAAAAAGALLLCWFLVPRLKAPARRAGDTQAVAGLVIPDQLPDPANDPHPTTPARPGPAGRKPDRNRAA